jgi:serine/threonine protein kinase
VIYNRERTGYEESNNYPIVLNEVIAGRYQIIEVLGQGAFATVMKVLDLLHEGKQPRYSCLKMINNLDEHGSCSKEHFDQALDEIRILRYVNSNCDPDASHLLKYYSCFYHKEHLFIETELLGLNLLDVLRKNRNFFSLGRLQTISRILLEGVARLNKMYVIHCDLKLENVLIKSFEPLSVKIADLGNSNFVHDHMTNYIQSRSYRAPEVILGLQPTQKVDVWSIGCIIAELWIGRIFFEGPTIQPQLANIQRLVGPWPQWMMEQGTLVDQNFLQENMIFMEEGDRCKVFIPQQGTQALEQRLRTDDKYFIDFVK